MIHLVQQSSGMVIFKAGPAGASLEEMTFVIYIDGFLIILPAR